MNHTFKKIWNIVSTALVVLVVLCAVFLMGSRLVGYECYNVISPSMEPEYGVGDLIYVKRVTPDTVKEGDVITFVMDQNRTVGTHRVVRVDTENQCFYTKGDANQLEDKAPVLFKNLLGVPQFSIPALGYVSDFIQNPPGSFITIGIGVLLILAVFLPDLLGKKKSAEDPALAAAQTEISAANEENERLKAELAQLRSAMAGAEKPAEEQNTAEAEATAAPPAPEAKED
ncbi:MAG: signal peptidase I [Clostridia bacterium]|nr:signal peptidase I [Clostridia bacterium]